MFPKDACTHTAIIMMAMIINHSIWPIIHRQFNQWPLMEAIWPSVFQKLLACGPCINLIVHLWWHHCMAQWDDLESVGKNGPIRWEAKASFVVFHSGVIAEGRRRSETFSTLPLWSSGPMGAQLCLCSTPWGPQKSHNLPINKAEWWDERNTLSRQFSGLTL